MDLVTEPECLDDVGAIRDVVCRAFHQHPSVADLAELIRASPQYVPELALVARIGRDVVGFVMLSHAEVVEAGGARHDVLTLSPLAVAPDHERQGIGSALVRAGLAAAEATGAGLVTLEEPDLLRPVGVPVRARLRHHYRPAAVGASGGGTSVPAVGVRRDGAREAAVPPGVRRYRLR